MGKDRADNNKRRDIIRCNEQIRIPQVMVIHEGRNLGTMSTREALGVARTLSLDLVEVAPSARPPVCHITDYGKYVFDKQKKEKEKAKTIAPKDKEVSFRYTTEDHDLETKINQIKGYVEKGHKVRLVVWFDKREKAHKDKGFEIMQKVLDQLGEIAAVEKPAGFEGANVTARVGKKKEVEKKAKAEKHPT